MTCLEAYSEHDTRMFFSKKKQAIFLKACANQEN
jgi:hypothetical protein